MKRLILLISALLIVVMCNAQSPFGGFFKPADQAVEQLNTARGVFDETTWLFRPNLALTAVAIDVSEKPVMTKALSSLGTGISFGKFTTINEQAYCVFSVNASLLTSVKLDDVVSTKVGGAVTLDVFNKVIGAGIGYLDGSVLILTTISYSF